MSQNDVQKIKDRLSIEEVVGSYLKLEKAGKNLKARCPFHNEKSPSFIVSPDRGTYYCFGCGAKGDIFSFVQQFEGLDFTGSLKVLADRAGIELTKSDFAEKDKYDRLRKILELSTKFYEACLTKTPKAFEYLKGRGLSEETIKEWRIGFAPQGWENLYSFLQKKGFKTAEIEETGLIKQGEKGKFYDRFRSRIIFPINDSSGRPVGFTGRIFEGKDDEAKYLNSPETPLFLKSKILYGFDKAKSFIRKLNFSILVEGQMDLIMCHQAGYKNAVASSGTALTDDQLRMISRISSNLVIAYDSDGAGFRASEKAWQMALNLGMDVKIAGITNGKDPADVIKNDPKEWKQTVKNSKHIIEIFIDKIVAEKNSLKLDERSVGKIISQKLIPYLVSIPSSIDQAHFIKMISEKFNLPEDSIRHDVEKTELKTDDKISKNKTDTPNNYSDTKLFEKDYMNSESLKIEKQLFGILFWQEKDPNSLVDCNNLKKQIQEILGNNFDLIFQKIQSEKDNLIFITEEIYSPSFNKKGNTKLKQFENIINELLKNLKLKYLSKERDICRQKLKQAEAGGDDSMIDGILKTIQKLSAEINNLN